VHANNLRFLGMLTGSCFLFVEVYSNAAGITLFVVGTGP
jgi:hypothetical protein